MLLTYVKGTAFQFFREEYTEKNALKKDSMVFKTVKDSMIESFATKLTVAQAAVQTINVKYEGGYTKLFLTQADKLYVEARFDDEA